MTRLRPSLYFSDLQLFKCFAGFGLVQGGQNIAHKLINRGIKSQYTHTHTYTGLVFASCNTYKARARVTRYGTQNMLLHIIINTQ